MKDLAGSCCESLSKTIAAHGKYKAVVLIAFRESRIHNMPEDLFMTEVLPCDVF